LVHQMTHSSKARGVRFEYRVAHFFERLGYSWDRSRSSLGTDLKILKNGELRYLVSCKKTSKSEVIYLPRREVERLSREALERRAVGLVCFGFHRTPIYALTVDELQEIENTKLSYKLTPENGAPLAEFLRSA